MTGEDVRIVDLRCTNACGGRITCVYLLHDRREEEKSDFTMTTEKSKKQAKKRTRFTIGMSAEEARF